MAICTTPDRDHLFETSLCDAMYLRIGVAFSQHLLSASRVGNVVDAEKKFAEKILGENFLAEKFLVWKIYIEKIPDGEVPIHRKKCGEKILSGKIPGEFFPTYRKNFDEKIPIGNFPDGKILGEKIPVEFVPSFQLPHFSKSGIHQRSIFARFLVPDLAPRDSCMPF